VIGLRQAGQTYDAIAAQVGLSPTGVFDISDVRRQCLST
jgi:methionine salvage enolase-phosphatase E1